MHGSHGQPAVTSHDGILMTSRLVKVFEHLYIYYFFFLLKWALWVLVHAKGQIENLQHAFNSVALITRDVGCLIFDVQRLGDVS